MTHPSNIASNWTGTAFGEAVAATLSAPRGSERVPLYTAEGVPITLRRVFGVLLQPVIGQLEASEFGAELSQRRLVLMDATTSGRTWPVTAGDIITIPADDLFEGGMFRVEVVRPYEPWHIELEVEVQPGATV
jgi:hypothetical protein